jgi:endoglucanase
MNRAWLRRPLLRLALAAAMLMAAAPVVAAPFQPMDPHEQVRRLGRGVNIIGYDPLWKEGGVPRFQDRHFKIIRNEGFGHVRIVLHAFRHMDAENRMPDHWLKKLDWAVAEATRNDLGVVLDLHEYLPCGQDPIACRPKIMAFWRQVADRYKDAPDTVVFELMNEPSEKMNEHWNSVMNEALAIVRASNPTRNVVVGPHHYNSLDFLHDMQLPPGDRHLIVDIHYYQPMPFTHQGAPWLKPVYPVGVGWGTDEERRRLAADFDKAQAWSKANGRPILLGEFSVIEKAAMADRARWIDAVARQAEKRGWAWSYWQFDNDFVVWDMKTDSWVEPIRKALIPEK